MAENQPETPAFVIGADEVRITAEMARLRLDEAEQLRMAGELSRILDFAASLREVDVTGVEPTTHAVPLSCPLREDLAQPHIPLETALANAPAAEGSFFTVPTILQGD